MDYFTVDTPDGRLLLVAEGEIKEGDDKRLHDFVAALPIRSKLFAVGLDSPGGNLREGVYLAKSIRSTGLPTIVSSRGMCASACFLMFAAGSTRMAAVNARIGVHSASSDGGDDAPAQAVTTLMARQAAEFGVPAAIIGKMVTTPPDEVTWLTRQDLAAMGTTILPADGSNYTPGSELVPGSSTPPTTSTQRNTFPPHDRVFVEGRNDRFAYEQWIAKLQGRFADGAHWWAANRSLVGASCQSAPDASDPQFASGCREAVDRLTHFDRRRLAEPSYRVGWNSL
ncbi:MAG: ATP-dependent Clp protease proteolytic subunit [Janthinobacterium lividum]